MKSSQQPTVQQNNKLRTVDRSCACWQGVPQGNGRRPRLAAAATVRPRLGGQPFQRRAMSLSCLTSVVRGETPSSLTVTATKIQRLPCARLQSKPPWPWGPPAGCACMRERPCTARGRTDLHCVAWS